MEDINFETYFKEVFHRDKDCPLFHDWVFEQMFHGEQLSQKVANKIRGAIYATLSTAFWTGDITKVEYGRELASRVKVPSGIYQGKKISELEGTPDVWTLLIQMKKTTKDDNIRQACIAKLNDFRIHKEQAQVESDRKAKNRKKK